MCEFVHTHRPVEATMALPRHEPATPFPQRWRPAADLATLRRTVGMDCEWTDPDQTGGRSFAGPVDELARAIDAYERLGIDDLIVRLQPSTPRALDRLTRAIQIRGH
jgi:hypothetical protein